MRRRTSYEHIPSSKERWINSYSIPKHNKANHLVSNGYYLVDVLFTTYICKWNNNHSESLEELDIICKHKHSI